MLEPAVVEIAVIPNAVKAVVLETTNTSAVLVFVKTIVAPVSVVLSASVIETPFDLLLPMVTPDFCSS